MGLFNTIFGNGSAESKPKFWNTIESEEDLQNAIQKSNEKKIAIFKHSTRCFISKTVLRNFEKEVQNSESEDTEYYYLDLIAYRALSNKIADIFAVQHQSPQLIVIKNGKAVANASHQSIDLSLVKNYG